ncbi:hypothetical protein [Enterobacter sp.]|uniref:hypothetical protein n=1 Tax=Enterobacter sp. TaxID=42895 RepID=UPI00296F1353|nr:hypothetical protein [Enterobacter sp.]
MSDIYKITITKKSKETFTGLMKRSQPEIINGFVALANDKGEWRYFSPDSIEDFLFEPVEDEGEKNGDLHAVDSGKDEVVASTISKDADAVLPDDEAGA